MPRRIKTAAERFRDRMIHNLAFAGVVGIGTNFALAFVNLRVDAGEASRFSIVRLVTYANAQLAVFTDWNRLMVVLAATALFALILSVPIYVLRLWAVTPLEEYIDVDNDDTSWLEWLVTLHLRVPYRLLKFIDTAVVGWVSYVVYLAYNPNTHVSWFRFLVNWRSPWKIVTNPENYPGLLLIFIGAALLVSGYHNRLRPHHEKRGRSGGALKPKKV